MLSATLNCITVHTKWLAGFNLLWNSNSGEVHFTGAGCASSHHVNRITLQHEHFAAGFYRWDGAKWQLYVNNWDPLTDPGIPIDRVRYSNCAFCKPELQVRG